MRVALYFLMIGDTSGSPIPPGDEVMSTEDGEDMETELDEIMITE